MKNLYLFLPVIYFLVLITSCGPSKEEIDAREKQKADSTTAAQQQILKTFEYQGTTNTETTTTSCNHKTYNPNSDFYIGIYSINGCEYISFGQGKGCCAVVHAGNCNNSIHYQNQQPTRQEDFPIN